MHDLAFGKMIKKIPETFAMVFINGMAKFVFNYIINQMVGQTHQMDV